MTKWQKAKQTDATELKCPPEVWDEDAVDGLIMPV